MMIKPSFLVLWKNFPDHIKYPTLKDLYTWLGGNAAHNINAPGFGETGNTCASRISVALNASKTPIKASLIPRNKSLSTADGHHIIFNVSTMRQYLLQTLGKPQVDNVSPYDDSFRGKRGLIAFSVNWSNATGHIALFDGAHYREAHDNYATFRIPRTATTREVKTSRGEFWELPL